jgi:hypothetical protein
MIKEKVEDTRDTGHNDGGVNKVDSMEPADGGPNDEPAVHQWSAVHEQDVGIMEDTGERREKREGDEMVQGGMENGEVEVIGICEEDKNT